MPWHSLWSAVVGLSTVAALLLGADKSGVRLFPVGKDSGFHYNALPGKNGLQFWAHEGELNCVLKLKMRGVSDSQRFTARFRSYEGWPAQLLAVNYEEGWLEIHQPEKKLPDNKFTWYPERPIELIDTQGKVQPADLENWSINPKEQGLYDSKTATHWRWLLTWVFLASLILPAYEGVKKITQTPEPMTPYTAVQGLVRSVEGSNAQETKQLRQLLQRVVFQGMTFNQALDNLGVTGASARGALWVKARNELRQLLDQVQSYRNLLYAGT